MITHPAQLVLLACCCCRLIVVWSHNQPNLSTAAIIVTTRYQTTLYTSWVQLRQRNNDVGPGQAKNVRQQSNQHVETGAVAA